MTRFVPLLLATVLTGSAAGQEPEPPTLVIESSEPSISAEALADALTTRLPEYRIVAGGAEIEGRRRIELTPGDTPDSVVIAVLRADGSMDQRELPLDPAMDDDLRLVTVALAASHMAGPPAEPEPALEPDAAPELEPVPEPEPEPEPPPPMWPEPAPPPRPEPVPPIELAVQLGAFGGFVGPGVDLAQVGPLLSFRLSWNAREWLAASFEAGWGGLWSGDVNEPFSMIPLRVGVDWTGSWEALRLRAGLRLAADVWTARYDVRETGVQFGPAADFGVAWFPWRSLGFEAYVGIDGFPEAVRLNVDDKPVFALGYLRWRAGIAVVGRP